MGSIRKRRFAPVVALLVVSIGGVAALATAAGPGGWDHLGDRGTPGSDSLDLVASALEVTPGALYVGGEFTDAGGIPNADRIATWNGSAWSAVSSSTSQISNGRVSDIVVSGGKVYAGGTFVNAGGDGNADRLAVWDGVTWKPFCNGTGSGFDGNVNALQIVGTTLYVGGAFQNGAGIAAADYLIACDLANNGAPDKTVVDTTHPFAGTVYALAADSNGTLYAGGGFSNLENIPAADNVAYLPVGGAWHAMGGGGGSCGCAVSTFVRGLTTIGTDAYVGSDANDIGGIAQADHVARWDGSWHAVGAGTGGANGWFPTTTQINALTSFGSNLFVAGLFQNANGVASADNVAWFDGTDWHPVGSDGAGNGPWIGEGLALAVVDRLLYATGSFTTAGGDQQARSAASYSLTQIIAFPTPTVTAGPPAQPTPTVTAGPAPVPTPTVTPTPVVDTKPPGTSISRALIDQSRRTATFKFASSERHSKFSCKLDKQKFKPCKSPKTYKQLKPGKHTFRVKARDRAGNVDATPKVKRFRIKRR